MKKLIILAIFGLFLGCDNPIETKNVSDNVPKTFTVELNTISDGVEIIECTEIYYTNLQQQGLILYRDGEIIKWVIPENLKYYKTK
jgi:hypothetical protein